MEVVTLQFGFFSNHVGAHYWNLQDEVAAQDEIAGEEDDGPRIEHARLYRCVERADHSESWRPRLLAVDLQGALGALRPGLDLSSTEDQPTSDLLWNEGVDVIRTEAISKHPYQEGLEMEDEEEQEEQDMSDVGTGGDGGGDGSGYCSTELPHGPRPVRNYDFQNTARTWTDYLKVQLPENSIRELQGIHHGVAPFPLYFEGLEVRGRGEEEILLDLVRRQIENCDQADAVQVVYDMHDGFGGVADLVLRWAREELPKAGKLVFGVMPDLSSTVDSAAASSARPPPALDWRGDAVEQEGTSALSLDREASSWVSAAFSFASILNCEIHAFAPVTVPLWSAKLPSAISHLRRDCMYEASALPAVALDNCMLPCRVAGGPRPSKFVGAFAPSNRPTCGLLQALPLPEARMPVVGEAPGSNDTLASLAPHLFDLTCMPALHTNPFTSVVLRGAHPRRLLNLTCRLPPPARQNSFVHPGMLPLPVPFPQAFGPAVSKRGVLMPEPTQEPCAPRPSDQDVEVLPVATQLHAAAGAGRSGALRQMAAAARSHRSSAWACAVRARYGVEADEFRDVLETITDHLECSAASESDDDSGCSD
eukprot:TRINITY_DN43825_c0_g1_i1.p1 TRINITY_DN43825_c0_g1~~TRINITY_DN43825_c0_g1_i1.p1  ORF type:complete len:593 (+),score=89.56 TRINITY_DN43825_c0_g1_i1:176-1954(+)